MNCQHCKTHTENIFIDLEDDGKLSYDVYEVCDNPDCGESWVIDSFEDDGEEVAHQMKITLQSRSNQE